MTLRTRMATARQRAYCNAALNPRVQACSLLLGYPEVATAVHCAITERQQSTSRDGRTTVTTTRREGTAVISRAAVAEIAEVEAGYYGKLVDAEGTEWRIVGLPFRDDAIFHLKLVVANIVGAGSARSLGSR